MFLLDVVLILVFLALTLATPVPHPQPLPHDPAATIVPGRVRPNFHDPADGLSGIQVAGIVVCSLVGLFILGFLALVTWDSYLDHSRRRRDSDSVDGLGFPVSK